MAAKCLATARRGRSWPVSQSLAGGGVEHGLDRGEGSRGHHEQGRGRIARPASTSSNWVRSGLETKSSVRSARWASLRAHAIAIGPRCEPPMPMLTIWRMALPVAPVQAPPRTFSAKDFSRSRTARTSGMTSTPSTVMARLSRLRRATWNTARFSVLIDMRAREHRRPAGLRRRGRGRVRSTGRGSRR